MTAEIVLTSLDPEFMVRAAERAGGILARYGEAFALSRDTYVPTADISQAAMLAGRLYPDGCEPRLLDARYFIPEPQEQRSPLLIFTTTTDYQPPVVDEEANRYLDAIQTAAQQVSQRARRTWLIDSVVAVKKSFQENKPAPKVEPPPTYTVQFMIDQLGCIAATHVGTGRPVHLTEEKKRSVFNDLLTAQPIPI